MLRCAIPPGAFLDIAGLDSELCHCFTLATEIEPADLRAFIDQGWLQTPAMHVAFPIADLLLDSLVSASLANSPQTAL